MDILKSYWKRVRPDVDATNMYCAIMQATNPHTGNVVWAPPIKRKDLKMLYSDSKAEAVRLLNEVKCLASIRIQVVALCNRCEGTTIDKAFGCACQRCEGTGVTMTVASEVVRREV